MNLTRTVPIRNEFAVVIKTSNNAAVPRFHNRCYFIGWADVYLMLVGMYRIDVEFHPFRMKTKYVFFTVNHQTAIFYCFTVLHSFDSF